MFAIYKIKIFNSDKIKMNIWAFTYMDILTFQVWRFRMSNIGGVMKSMCVFANVMISKNRIFNSRLLDPNQEHQALIPLVGHREGGEYVTS